MNDNQLNSISKFISLLLRHKPEIVGLKINEHGWANTKELVEKINANSNYEFDMNLLERIVTEDKKERYSFNSDKTLIRANQGHSITVNVELNELEPPEILYHGTATKFIESINKEGIKKMERLYVHLSQDIDTAEKVGKRHGKLAIIKVSAKQMYKAGYKFYKSINGVWLTEYIPTKYIEIV